MANINTLIDDFSGTTLDTTKWTDGSTPSSVTTVSGGKLHLPTNNAAAGAVSQITSTASYTWALFPLYARLVPSTTANVRTSLIAYDSAAGSLGLVEVYYLNGTMNIRAVNNTGSVLNSAAIGTYDPVGWNYWHFQFSGSTLNIARSADTTTLTTVVTAVSLTTWSSTAFVRLATLNTNGGPANESLADSVNVRSPADFTYSTSVPRMQFTRATQVAQRTVARIGTSTPRTITSRMQAGSDGVAPRTYSAMSGPRMTITRATAISQTITDTGSGSGTVITRPTTGLLWPPGAWARR